MGLRPIRWVLALVGGVALAAVLVASAADAVRVNPGQLILIEVSENTKVLVDDCEGVPSGSGPTYSTFEIHPEDAASVLGLKPEVASLRAGTAKARIRVATNAVPGQSFIVGWTAVANGCYSANGSITYTVARRGKSRRQAAITPPSKRVEHVDCGLARHGSRQIEVAAEGISCATALELARRLLRGVPLAGYRCTSSRPESWARDPSRRDRILWVCARSAGSTSAPPYIAAGPPAESCSSVAHGGRTYLVEKARVTCGFARNTVRRMLTGETPYVYELVASGATPQWVCTRYGGTAGTCVKRSEGRYVAYFLAK